MVTISRAQLGRTVVAVDPAVTSGEDSNDSGIIAVARGPHQPETCSLDKCPGHGYVLKDATCHLSPPQLSRRIISVYDELQADRVVAEVNNGGDYIGAMIHAIRADVAYRTVTASRGKHTRAEPASALYEQGRVHHCDSFPELAQEQETWTPDASWSPNRLDALVWALTELRLIGGQGAAFMVAWANEREQQASSAPRASGLDHEEPVGLVSPKPGCQHRWKAADGGIMRCMLCQGEKA